MKKIFIISNDMWSLYNFRYELIEEIAKKMQVIIFCEKDKYVKHFYKIDHKFVNINIKKSRYNFIKDFFSIIKIIYYLVKLKPSYILTFTIKPNIYLLLISKFLKINVVPNITGLGSIFLNKNLINRQIFSLYKHLIKYSYFVFFQNTYDRNEILSNFNLRNRVKSDILPGSGINLKKYLNVGVSKKHKKFIFAGRLIKDKGIIDVINALQMLKDKNFIIPFLVIGDPDQGNPSSLNNKHIEKLVRNNLIEYLGHTDSINEHLRNAQCIVIPSYREGCSRVIMEGAALGKPIITYDVPGCNNLVIDNFNGYLVEKGDIVGLADAIIKFDNLNISQKNQMGKFGRKLIEKNYLIDTVINKYIRLLK